MAGTPLWCELCDRDPIKWTSVLDAAQHWALRIETCQQAECEASRDLSAAEDWSGIASKMVQRHGVYIPREVAS